jgi:hypothetical protein
MVLWSETIRASKATEASSEATIIKANPVNKYVASALATQHPYTNCFRNSVGFVEDPPRVYTASCYCGRVKYHVRGEPSSSKVCHCTACQVLHGAPFEWVAIFAKDHVKFEPTSLKHLHFYSSEADIGWSSKDADKRQLPVKVSCSHCRTPIADEGKHMWLAFCTLFGFRKETGIPKSWQPSCHLFYQQRCMDIKDAKTKWEGQRKISSKYKDEKDWPASPRR